MTKLSKDDVLKLAALSRLKLTEAEVKQFSEELPRILDYVGVLDKVDTKGLEPTYQLTGLKNVMRSDEIKSYRAAPDELLKQAPATQNRQYMVKRVL